MSSAVSELARRELVESTDGGWLLKGDPPGELVALAPARYERGAAAGWEDAPAAAPLSVGQS